MIAASQLNAAAARILASDPDPLVRLRLRRVIGEIAGDPAADRQILAANPWVAQLASEQQGSDGLWDFGPGHSSIWYWPLSARRGRMARAQEHSVRVLSLCAVVDC